MSIIRVVLADDHAFVRTGIRNILHKTGDIVVVGEAGDGLGALELARQLKPDVVVLDMEMPGMKGYEVAQELARRGPAIPILALSAHEDRHFILTMLAEGAHGYLTKDEVPETIVKALRGVAQGERGWVSRRVAARIGMWMQGESQDWIKLSRQDIQLLRLFTSGKTSAQISDLLALDNQVVEQRLDRAVYAVRARLQLFDSYRPSG